MQLVLLYVHMCAYMYRGGDAQIIRTRNIIVIVIIIVMIIIIVITVILIIIVIITSLKWLTTVQHHQS